MEPVAEQIKLPRAYGTPTRLLTWAEVERRLAASMHYWVATVTADGPPHVRPVDGIWLDRALWFGGDPRAAHQRNLRANPHVSVHLEDGGAATILEGAADRVIPERGDAGRLARAAEQKYGYPVGAAGYRAGVWRVRPAMVLAWTAVHLDATRFRFPGVRA